jgi:hypothetical protein
MKGLSMLFALLLVSITFMPIVSAKTQSQGWESQFLENSGYTVNTFEQTITSSETLGNQIIYSGNYKIDVQKNIDGTVKRLNTEGVFKEIINADGSVRIECISNAPKDNGKGEGNNFNLVTDLKKIGEVDGKTRYQVNQQISADGKNHVAQSTFDVPKQQTGVATVPDAAMKTLSKTKYDLPSHAPAGAILVYHDIQASQLMSGAVILSLIAAYFGGAPGVLLAFVIQIIDAVPALLGVAKEDIYVDVFLIPWASSFPDNIYMEVDYYYK